MKTRARGTDASLLGSLPWTLLALGIAMAPHLPYLPAWITAVITACGLWRYSIERRRRALPSPWVRGGLALVCFLGVLFTFSAISGVGPGSALLAVMAALKLLETRLRRDQFVLLFISIFLLMSSLLREQYLWSLPYLVFSTLVIMTAWLRMSAGEQQTARSSFRASGRLLMYAAPIAIAMWIFFPRLSTPFWAVPIDTSRATTGISDRMSPGDISNLSTSSAVAFRVKFDEEVPPPRERYWRVLVLSNFNGRTWAASTPIDHRRLARSEIEYRGAPYRYTITMEPTQQQFLYALEMPRDVTGVEQVRVGRHQQLWHVTPIEQRLAYTVDSYTEYVLQSTMSRGRRGWYLDIPEEGNQRSAELATEMRSASRSDDEFVDSVLRFFNEQAFFYTLEPPPLGNNPIDRFLFDTRRGFCEHYASAFTYMMRAAGIPARVVVGFQGGEINPLGGHMVVRMSDAHAWSEVWIEGKGWLRVDPTAAVAPERIEYSAGDPEFENLAASWGFSGRIPMLDDLALTWDAINARWNDWILGYGPEKQSQFMESLGMDDPTWRKMLFAMISLVVVIIVAISGLLILRYRPPKQDPAVRLYQKFVRRSGIVPAVGETASSFAYRAEQHGRLSAADINAVTDAYIESRYGAGGPQQLERLKRAISSAKPRAA